MNNLYDKVWSEKYRPKNIDDVVLEEGTKDFFRNKTDIPNLLFYGKPGTGKTTVAKILADSISPDSYLYINASETNGIDMIRNDIKTFVSTRSMDGTKKTVILDEADGLSSATSGTGSSAQSALRNLMEENLDNVRFILTANYANKIIRPLLSRCVSYEFTYDIKDVTKRMISILKEEKIKITQDDIPSLKKMVKDNFPDIRKCINQLQHSCSSGSFVYKEKVKDNDFASTVYDMIKEDSAGTWQELCYEIRSHILNNEDKFGNDYSEFLRSIFQVFVDNNESPKSVLIITDAIEKNSVVMDMEINCFSMIIRLVMEEKQK